MTKILQKENLDTQNLKTLDNFSKQEGLQQIDLEELAERFDCKYNPKVINFREDEFNFLRKFFENCFKEISQSKNLLISGQPGCGKTTLINYIMNDLEKIFQTIVQIKKLKFNKFTFNAMNYENTTKLIQEIFKQFKSTYNLPKTKNINCDEMIKQIKNIIICQEEITVICIDEFDQLFQKSVNQTQYGFRLLELADLPKSKLIFLGISNTMDLVYKLSQKYKQDLRFIQNLIFQPYEKQKIQQIIIQRLDDSKIFDLNAVQFCVQKIFKLKGGDIRSILDVLRKAILNKQKLCDNEEKTEIFRKINLQEISQTIQQLYNIRELSQIIKQLPETQQIALIAIYRLTNKSQERQFDFKNFSKVHNQVSNNLMIPHQDSQILREFISIFEQHDLIKIISKNSRKSIKSNDEYILNIEPDEIFNSLSENDLYESLF